MILAETPSNPLLELVDLTELGAIKGPFKVVDSTFATPLGQSPLRLGAEPVVTVTSESTVLPSVSEETKDAGRETVA